MPVCAEFFDNGLEMGVGPGWGSSEYNEVYFVGAQNSGAGLVDLTASVTLSITLSDDGWMLTPTIAYSSLIDDDLRDNHGEENLSLIWGLNLAIFF